MILVYLAMIRLSVLDGKGNIIEGEFAVSCEDPDFFGQFGFRSNIEEQTITVTKNNLAFAEQKGPDSKQLAGMKKYQLAALACFREIYNASQGQAEGFEGQSLTRIKTPLHEDLLLDLLLACQK
jgi:hypothetical protein